VTLVLGALACAACVASGDGPQGPNSGASANLPGAGGLVGAGPGGATLGAGASPGGVAGGGQPGGSDGPCVPSVPARLTLLSDYQHLNSLRALFGANAISVEDAAENTAKTKPFTQKGVVVNTSLVHQRQTWAQFAGQALNTRFAELTTCDPAKVDDACAARFLKGFAARAFRRPVEADEITDVMAVYNVGKVANFTNGVKRAVEAVLSAPSFMYRRELGKPNAEGSLTLTPHELASELSYMLTDQPPDAELMGAADKGALDDAEVARQVDRMLQKADVRASLRSTLMSSWGIANLFGTIKDPKLFPEYNPQLQGSMFRETELFVDDVLWTRSAPIGELLTARTSFVNKSLATLYGVPYTGTGDAFAPVTLPKERSGLLTQASVLSTLARTDTTSVVARGIFVRAMLCLAKLPEPPASLAGEIQDLLKADMTERQRADVRAKNATCAGCHVGIDPFGLLLESYDPLGKYRTTLKGMTIDPSADVMAGSISGNFKDALGFLEAAADSPDFVQCVGTRLLSYATQDEGLKAASCQVKGLFDSLPVADATMPQLVKAITASPALRLRTKE
jgi:hypothetical protein